MEHLGFELPDGDWESGYEANPDPAASAEAERRPASRGLSGGLVKRQPQAGLGG